MQKFARSLQHTESAAVALFTRHPGRLALQRGGGRLLVPPVTSRTTSAGAGHRGFFVADHAERCVAVGTGGWIMQSRTFSIRSLMSAGFRIAHQIGYLRRTSPRSASGAAESTIT